MVTNDFRAWTKGEHGTVGSFKKLWYKEVEAAYAQFLATHAPKSLESAVKAAKEGRPEALKSATRNMKEEFVYNERKREATEVQSEDLRSGESTVITAEERARILNPDKYFEEVRQQEQASQEETDDA